MKSKNLEIKKSKVISENLLDFSLNSQNSAEKKKIIEDLKTYENNEGELNFQNNLSENNENRIYKCKNFKTEDDDFLQNEKESMRFKNYLFQFKIA